MLGHVYKLGQTKSIVNGKHSYGKNQYTGLIDSPLATGRSGFRTEGSAIMLYVHSCIQATYIRMYVCIQTIVYTRTQNTVELCLVKILL